MKRFMQVLLMAILVSMFATACGQDNAKDNNKAEENQSKETANKEAKADEKKEKELTAEEITEKSSKVMNNWAGMSYNMTGKTHILAQQGDEKQEINQDLNMQSKVTNKPFAMELTGTVSMEGQKVPVNSYYKDKTMYQEAPGQGWIAINGMDLEALQQNSQSQNPSEQIQQFTKMMKEIQDSGDENKYVKKEEKDGLYIISLELDEKGLSILKDQAKDIMKQSMGEQIQQIAGDALDKMKYNSMNVVFYIDKNTFEQKKLNQKMSISMEQDGATMTMDMDITLDSLKKFDGEIEVPEDVKKDAQEISMEDLQQAQQ
ncbi:hypothetical protein QR721_00095 [Aciduricibacillus chroicocephali]|uniref:Lipoprotein n=1 Tax=Aciduricibacillus chroicocephali TaxID=3054939 RepID=A0ABY9KVE3_9BACI|nr:hypothetical protein QR721_00095 [Bacillaceae bacterium 44XB]